MENASISTHATANKILFLRKPRLSFQAITPAILKGLCSLLYKERKGMGIPSIGRIFYTMEFKPLGTIAILRKTYPSNHQNMINFTFTGTSFYPIMYAEDDKGGLFL